MLILYLFIPCFFHFVHLKEMLDFEIIESQNNVFDGIYKIYSARNYAPIFPYNKDSACLVYRDAYGIQVQIDSFKTFSSSAKRLVSSIRNASSIKIEACFELEDHSFLIYRDKNNKTTIINLGRELILKSETSFDKFVFDSVKEELYLIKKGKIQKINKKIFLDLWNNMPLLEKQFNIQVENTWIIDKNISDVFIINSIIYCIKQGAIYRKSNENFSYVSEINSQKFNFIPYLINNKEEIKMVSIDNFKSFLIQIFYLIEIIIVLIFAYIFRKKIVKRNKNNSQEINNDVYQSMTFRMQ